MCTNRLCRFGLAILTRPAGLVLHAAFATAVTLGKGDRLLYIIANQGLDFEAIADRIETEPKLLNQVGSPAHRRYFATYAGNAGSHSPGILQKLNSPQQYMHLILKAPMIKLLDSLTYRNDSWPRLN